MSKCQTSYSKKQNWGCSDSVMGLSSTGQASDEVVVENYNAHSFSSSDARRQDGFYVSECVPKGNTSVVSRDDDTLYGNNSNLVNTRYVYNNALDRKFVQGLLARGKKATLMVKQFQTPIKVNTRVFTDRPEPKSVKPRENSHARYPHEDSSEIPVSGTRVLGCPSFQHIESSTPIVAGQDTSRTSCDNNGQLISQSYTDNAINGHIHNGECGSDRVIDVSMEVNNNGNGMSNSGVNNQESGKHVNSNQVSDVTECGHNSVKANVFNVCQGSVTPDNVIDNVLLYDVNIGLSDFNLELSNAMLLKDGWKKHVD